MDTIIIALVAAAASLLTFFSGFGLGTILTPVFLIFFPIETAVALTAIVHFLNNLFKLLLIGKHTHWQVLLAFGIPAGIGSYFGAKLLFSLSGDTPLYSYTLSGTTYEVTPLALTIAALMFIFSLWELVPALKSIQFGRKVLIPGGLLSGFFGGLSGHQGALRSAFLIRFNLSKEAFVATGVVIACFVDITRLAVYLPSMEQSGLFDNLATLAIATGAAFAGALAGRQLLRKITIDFVQTIVGVLIMLMAVGLGMGWI